MFNNSNLWGNNEKTFNPDTFNSSMIPGNTGQVLTSSQLANIGNSDFGWQAGANGNQTGLQKMLFDAPSYNAQGVGVKGGMNLDGLGSIMQGVGGMAKMYTALKSIGIAKDNLQFQKDSYNTNLGNQTKTYNTNLEDRTRTQYRTEGKTSADVDSYLQKNRL
jgi:hypothetical protein|tara:strand:- start:242 stop:727 length:486 start_codon:yes stop_codon:yes gene_type:complete